MRKNIKEAAKNKKKKQQPQNEHDRNVSNTWDENTFLWNKSFFWNCKIYCSIWIIIRGPSLRWPKQMQNYYCLYAIRLFWPIWGKVCRPGSHCGESCANRSIWWHWFRDRVIKQQEILLAALGVHPALNIYFSITSSRFGILFGNFGNMHRFDKSTGSWTSRLVWVYITITMIEMYLDTFKLEFKITLEHKLGHCAEYNGHAVLIMHMCNIKHEQWE